jgi:hypothetical protein
MAIIRPTGSVEAVAFRYLNSPVPPTMTYTIDPISTTQSKGNDLSKGMTIMLYEIDN